MRRSLAASIHLAALLSASLAHASAIVSASGGGGTTTLVVASTPITGGTTTRILYDNAGVVGEYSISGTGSVAMTANPVFTTDITAYSNIKIGRGGGSVAGNVVVGDNALASNTTGSNNTVFGSNAMQLTTTGANNVAGGNAALRNATTGSNNVAIGDLSLYTATVGSGNTFAGQGSGFALTSGGANAGFGANALSGLTTGASNIGVGTNAGNAITTGSNNVVIGGSSGASIASLSNWMLFADGGGNERFHVDSTGAFQLGAGDAAAPVAQTFQTQSVLAGTTNTAGANFTINGSRSTGSGTSGDIILQTGGTGAAATAQNALVNAIVVKGGTQNVVFPLSISVSSNIPGVVDVRGPGGYVYTGNSDAVIGAFGAGINGLGLGNAAGIGWVTIGGPQGATLDTRISHPVAGIISIDTTATGNALGGIKAATLALGGAAIGANAFAVTGTLNLGVTAPSGSTLLANFANASSGGSGLNYLAVGTAGSTINFGNAGTTYVGTGAFAAGYSFFQADAASNGLNLAASNATGTIRFYTGGNATGNLALTLGATQNAVFGGSVTVASTTLLTTSVALTNGAGVGAGTLTNAPAAGNPTKWIPINDNGTTRYIPAW